MKDFSFWRDAMQNVTTALSLKSVGEDLARFQGQQEIFNGETKLTDDQLAGLRKIYAARMKKLLAETLKPQGPKRAGFQK